MNKSAIETTLQSKLGELEERLAQVSKDMSKSHSADFAEQVAERENDEVLEEIKAETEASVMNVLAALARVREGTYGQCTRCGEAISPERLAAIPEAALCMSCAGK